MARVKTQRSKKTALFSLAVLAVTTALSITFYPIFEASASRGTLKNQRMKQIALTRTDAHKNVVSNFGSSGPNPYSQVTGGPMSGIFGELNNLYGSNQGTPFGGQATQQLAGLQSTFVQSQAKLAQSLSQAKLCMLNSSAGSPLPNNLISTGSQLLNQTGAEGFNNALVGQLGNALTQVFSSGVSNASSMAGFFGVGNMLGNQCNEEEDRIKLLTKHQGVASDWLKRDERTITCDMAHDYLELSEGKLAEIGQDKCKIKNLKNSIECMQTAEKAIREATEAVSTAMGNLTTAAQSNVEQREQFVDAHKSTSEQLMERHNSLQGKLSQLETIANELEQAITGDVGFEGEIPEITIGSGDEGIKLPGGLEKRATRVKDTILATLSRQMQNALVSSVQQCFTKEHINCVEGHGTMSFGECAQAYLQSVAPEGFEELSKLAGRNLSSMSSHLNLDTYHATSNASAGDFKNPETILNSSKNILSQIRRSIFSSIINTDAPIVGARQHLRILASRAQAHFDRCRQDKIRKYNLCAAQDFKACAPELQVVANAAVQGEQFENHVKEDAKKWLNFTTRIMSQFREEFFGESENELAAMNVVCKNSETAEGAVQCLKLLQKSLYDGIHGLNGDRTIAMYLPAANKDPQLVQCNGFKKCLDNMRQSANFHNEQVSKQTGALQTFVREHNQFVDQTMQMLAKQTQAVQQGEMQNLMNAMNAQLATLGVNATMKMRAIEGEPLERGHSKLLGGDGQGIYQTPMNTMAALAGKASIQEIDPDSIAEIAEAAAEEVESLNEQRDKISNVRGEVAQMYAECKFTESDLNALQDSISQSFCRKPVTADAGTTIKPDDRVYTCGRIKSFFNNIDSMMENVTNEERRSRYSSFSSTSPFDEVAQCVEKKQTEYRTMCRDLANRSAGKSPDTDNEEVMKQWMNKFGREEEKTPQQRVQELDACIDSFSSKIEAAMKNCSVAVEGAYSAKLGKVRPIHRQKFADMLLKGQNAYQNCMAHGKLETNSGLCSEGYFSNYRNAKHLDKEYKAYRAPASGGSSGSKTPFTDYNLNKSGENYKDKPAQ